jgi:hypothetical protein
MDLEEEFNTSLFILERIKGMYKDEGEHMQLFTSPRKYSIVC